MAPLLFSDASAHLWRPMRVRILLAVLFVALAGCRRRVEWPMPAPADGAPQIGDGATGEPGRCTLPSQTSAVGRTDPESLQQEGAAHFEAGEFVRAAAAWRRILDVLPENATNREERETTLLIALEAYKEAARSLTHDERAQSCATALLREGVALLDRYVDELHRALPSVAIGPAVDASGAELRAMLEAMPAPSSRA
jgi:hypothetical protein